MIVEDSDNTSADIQPDGNEELPSKSQRKRDAHAIRALGEEIAALGDSERARVPLPEDVRDAIEALIRTRAHGARKRQLGFVAKKMRDIEIEPIEAALEGFRQAAREHTGTLHLIERWRDRLLGDLPPESPADALTALLSEFHAADRQRLRQLQRAALAERTAQKPPRQARLLFKEIRQLISPS